MNTHEKLVVGHKYSKKDLSNILDEPNLVNRVGGIYFQLDLFFVDLDKDQKNKNHQYNDYYDGEYFHWDSQEKQHLDTPYIQKIINDELTPNLFVRVKSKINNETQPFIYCGRLKYEQFENDTRNPVHLIFRNIDYDDFNENEELIEIYFWKPEKVERTSKSKISKKDQISEDRKNNYKKPTKTERKGLVTSRVGQGWYRREIVRKWKGKCPISKVDIPSILISSHILPWSSSTDEQRLDVNNGILLSPVYDSLFDRNLISFEDNGEIIISSKVSLENRKKLNIDQSIKIPINKEMIPYLKEHRKELRKLENNE